MNGNEIWKAITKMAQDDNRGLLMSTTVTGVSFVSQGAIVEFGTTEEVGTDINAAIVTGGALGGDYMAVAFFIKREELEKYKQ